LIASPIRRVLVASAVLIGGPMLSAQAVTPAVSLSARVNITNSEHQTQSSRAENVVVWLAPADSGAPSRPFPSVPLRLTQHHKSFEPHVLVVPVGAVVEFPNHDPFFHNVFSLFEGKRFDLGLYEAGTTRNVSFDRPGISYIFCNIHAEMSAVVLALDTPYYAVSNRKGEIVIRQVPVGRYTMHVWYETALPSTLSAMTREITVAPESSTLGVLDIPAGLVVNAHKNKYGMDYEPPAPDAPGYDHP
jgi:plastocyanin